MRLLTSLLILSLILGPAWSKVSYSAPRNLPKGSYVKVGENQLRAFTLEEFKIILHIHADYVTWYSQVPKLKDQATNLTELVQNQKRQLSLADENIKILKDERKLLTEKWEKENKLRHECENKPAFGSWVAWGSAGAMGLVATVLAVILIARD